MGRYFITWTGLLLFVIGTSIWLFPSIPAIPRGYAFDAHLVIPLPFCLMLVFGGIALMLITRTQDDSR